jgi:DTW domain-containing protein YfiP
MAREMCYRCFWPKALCWCPTLQAIETRTRFVFLMHPKEFKRERVGTGRLTQLCLPHSTLHMGLGFDDHEEVQALLADPRYFPVLLYPGCAALNISEAIPADGALAARFSAFFNELARRTLLVVILDATWSGARKMLRLSPSLQGLPRIMFTPAGPSRFVIKQQPQGGCLSTIEATHELLTVLEAMGMDHYPHPAQLLAILGKMQDYQMRCAADPLRPGYRHRPYTEPASRVPPRGRSGSRRENYLKKPPGGRIAPIGISDSLIPAPAHLEPDNRLDVDT